jgi:hypothetical protein
VGGDQRISADRIVEVGWGRLRKASPYPRNGWANGGKDRCAVKVFDRDIG